jgi:hypothetical protein
MIKKKAQREEEEMKKYTFQPNLNTKKYKGKAPKLKKENISKLFEDAAARDEKRKQITVPVEIKEFEKVKSECCFTPKILMGE